MADGYGNERPHYLSDEKVNWVVNASCNSVFSVRVQSKAAVESDKDIVNNAVEAYNKLNASRLKSQTPREPTRLEVPVYITGSAIGEKGGMVRILTSTIGIKPILPQRKGYPTIEEIGLVFKFEVKCLHEEERHKKELSKDGSPYWNAKVLYADCRKDLLLLEADVKAHCHVDHPAICLATSHHPESKGMLVFLHGWPRYCEGSVTRGRISSLGRQVNHVLGCPSAYKYDMKVIEIFDGCCCSGFSGGPVINGNLDCLGLFHGTYNNNGYATSWEDIIRFLWDFEETMDDHDKNDGNNDDPKERGSKRQKIEFKECPGSSGLAASKKEKGTVDVKNVATRQ